MGRAPPGEDESFQDDGLPPVDRGFAAWRFVLGVWFAEALLWGFPLSFGIFQAHYSQLELFRRSNNIPTVGALATGMSHFGMLFVSPLAVRYARFQLHMVWLGWCICVSSLVAASFATQVWHLMLCQGILYGVGWVMCYTPFLIMLNEWFVKKRGLAYGIIFGASGVSGLILPFLLEASLNKYGFRITLRAFALAVVVLSGPGIMFLKPRVIRSTVVPEKRGPVQFLKQPIYWLFTLSIFFQGFGYYLPNIFLPSYAHALLLSHTQGALLLSLCSLAQVTGQITLGHLSDKFNIYFLSSLSGLVSALATFFLWGPAKTLPPLTIFSLVYSAFGGSYTVLWLRIITNCITDDPAVVMTIFGAFGFTRGIANVLAGPVSTRLLGEVVEVSQYGIGQYRGIVIFVGTTMALCSLSGVAYFREIGWHGPWIAKTEKEVYRKATGYISDVSGSAKAYELERLSLSSDGEQTEEANNRVR